MRTDLPNQIHMVLCYVIPLAVSAALFWLCSGFPLPLYIVPLGCLASLYLTAIASYPLVFALYKLITKEPVPYGASIHEIDNGCTTLIVLVLLFLALPALMSGYGR